MAKKNTILGAMNTGNVINKRVNFGVGGIDRIIAASDSSQGLIAFGYNDTLNSGAIAVGGQLVSSKILDVTTNISEGAGTVTVSYLAQNGTVATTTFDIISRSAVESLITGGTSGKLDEIDASIVRLNSSVNTLEDAVDDLQNTTFVQTITGTNGITATESGADANKTYTITTNVDNTTIFNKNNQLAGLTYAVQEKATATTGYLKSYELVSTNPSTGATTSLGTIDIPKDFLVRSGSVGTVTVADQPYTGAVVGDKYIDFVINTPDDVAAEAEHVYIPVNDLIDIYTGDGDGSGSGYITVNNNNVISFKAAEYKTNVIDPIVTNINASIGDISTRLANSVNTVNVTDYNSDVNIVNASTGVSAITAEDGLTTIEIQTVTNNGSSDSTSIEELVNKSTIDEIAKILTTNEIRNNTQDSSINTLETNLNVTNSSVNSLENALVWMQIPNA